MVSVNPNPPPDFCFFDPTNMGHSGLNSMPPPATATASNPASTTSSGVNRVSFSDDPNKKMRKPYTITKSRESWTEQEHDKFLEALHLFDRNWKKIEAYVGSKSVIQIRSHAQKYFLKVQKSGTSEHVPPPRPKRKAAHPYPQKAPKNAAQHASQVTQPFQCSSALLEPGYIYGPDSSSLLGNPSATGALPSSSYNSVPPVSVPQVSEDDAKLAGTTVAHNCCYNSAKESNPRTWKDGSIIDQQDQGKPMRVMPDFAQVYSFIGSVFDPNARGHLQRLKQMDPINLQTALLLMRNLSINLTSPEFENHRRLLETYEVNPKKAKFGGAYSNESTDKSGSAITAA